MRTRDPLAFVALIGLACGFLGDRETPPAPPPAAPTTAPPAPAPDAAPVGKTDWDAQPPSLVQPAQVTIVNPDIPEGTVLAEVKPDYEYLYRVGDVQDCPAGTTAQEKKHGDTHQRFCGLTNGVRHGPWIDYWPNQKPREIGPYVAGFRQGTFVTWDARGKVTSRYSWENGQVGTGRVYE